MTKPTPITWRDLLEFLSDTLRPEDLDCHVAICNDGEFFQCVLLTSEGDDILDDGHPYLEAIL